MAHLLDLVDKLIGSSLRGNLFTDKSTFLSSPAGVGRSFSVPDIRQVGITTGPQHVSPFNQTTSPAATLQSPDPVFTPSQVAEMMKRPNNADSGIPNVGLRPLNVPAGTQHPHAQSNIIPPPQHGPPSKPQSPDTTPVSSQADTASGFNGPATKRSTILELAAFHNEVTKQVDNLKANIGPPTPPLLERSSNVLIADNREKIANTFHEKRIGPNVGPHGPEQLVAGQGSVKAISDLASPKGNIQDNIYGDSGYTAVQGPGGTVLKYVDIVAGVKWLENLQREGFPIPLGGTAEAIFKGTQWNASQALLAFFNPTDTAGHGPLNAVWNPLSLALSALPLTRLSSPTNITVGAAFEDVGIIGGGYQKRVMDSVTAGDAPVVGERLLQMRNGQYVKSIDGNQVAQVRGPDVGFRGDLAAVAYGGHPSLQAEQSNSLLGAAIGAISSLIGSPAIPGLAFTVNEQVSTDAPLGSHIHGNLYNPDRPYSAKNALMPLEKVESQIQTLEKQQSLLPTLTKPDSVKIAALFNAQAFPGAGGVSNFLASSGGSLSWAAKRVNPGDIGVENTVDAPGLNAAVVDVGFVGEKTDPDTAASTGIVEGDTLDDNNVYMPFMFQDLRDTTDSFLYFRAFLKPGVSETFTPDWQQERYYGRVDKVPTYMGTSRTINLSFDVAAFKPSDLSVMYRKLEKLQSMVYPTYNLRGFMNAGPIIRMRVGDLFASDNEGGAGRGLPGYITSLDFSFEDGIWNLKTDFKVPRMVTVSLSFTVVHNGSPGTYEHLNVTVSPSGEQVGEVAGERTFGVAKFTPDGKNTKINVSRGEMRRIFKTIRGSS